MLRAFFLLMLTQETCLQMMFGGKHTSNPLCSCPKGQMNPNFVANPLFFQPELKYVKTFLSLKSGKRKTSMDIFQLASPKRSVIFLLGGRPL